MGLLPDGRQPHAADSLDTPDGGVADAAEQSGEISYGVRQVLRLPSFYLLATAFTLAFMVGPGLILHMIPYFTDRGLEAGQAVWIVAMWSASGSLGSLMFGLLTERFGARLVLAADFFLMALCIFWLLFIQSLPVGLVWGFFLGLTMGGMMVLYQVIFADYYGRNSLGAIRGVIWPVQMGSNSMGPLSVALVFDSTDSYIPIFAVFGVLTLASALCVFLARPPQPVGSAPEAVQETSPSTVVASSAVDGDG
jgi:MFS family permease